MKHTLQLLTALLLAPSAAIHAPAAEAAWRSYEVYEPVIDVMCPFGDSRVPVRLVHEYGAIYLCGQNTKQTRGPLNPGWNTVDVETVGKTTSASLNGAAAKQATHQPKGTWIYLGHGYREGTYPADSAFEIDVSSVATRVQK